MNIDDIKSEIQTKITNQTEDNSITPESLGEVLSDMCDFAASASQETYSAITAEVADITTIKSQEAEITSLSSTTISVGNAEIASLSSTTINVENLIVDEITASTASISELSASTINGKDASEILFGNGSANCLGVWNENLELIPWSEVPQGTDPDIEDKFLNGIGDWVIPPSSQGYSGSSTIDITNKTISAKGYNYALSGDSKIFEINKTSGDDGVKITNTPVEDEGLVTTNLQIKATGAINIIANSNNDGSYGSSIECHGDLNIKTKSAGRVVMSSQATAKVNGVSDVYLGCPIGTIVMWAGETAPSGWLLCAGQIIPTTSSDVTTIKSGYGAYKNLFNVIGTTYGKKVTGTGYVTDVKGDLVSGYGVFIPNLQQRFPLGAESDSAWTCGSKTYNTNLGQTGGTKEVTLTADESGLPAHKHTLTYNVSSDNGSTLQAHSSTGSDTSDQRTTDKISEETKNASRAHDNIPPYLALNFIIKYQ